MTDKDTLIEKYLYDELSETDVQEFEQRLESDAEFADEVKLRSVIFAKNKSDFKQLLKANDPTVVMGENDDIAAWRAATIAFQQDNYAAAAYEIEKIASPNTEQQFYLGLAYLYQKNYDKSITQFEPVAQQKSIDYSPPSRWYMSLAYLKNKQAKQAKKYLEQIVKDKSWRYKEAQKLLNDL